MNFIPRMTYSEKQARSQAKRLLIMGFLASGEVYTNLAIAARVMCVSTSSAERTLAGLLRDGVLKKESHYVLSRKTHIFGITTHGLALADQIDNPFFELGRTNSSYIPHHLQTQQSRLAAEAEGWTDWQPGKILYRMGLKKVPDALCTSPSGERVAVEIERHIKSKKRYEEIISSHLQAIKRKLWDEIHYLSSDELVIPLQKVFEKIETIPVLGERHALEEKHRARFKFVAFNDWPKALKSKMIG